MTLPNDQTLVFFFFFTVSLFRHFITSLIKFILWLRFFPRKGRAEDLGAETIGPCSVGYMCTTSLSAHLSTDVLVEPFSC